MESILASKNRILKPMLKSRMDETLNETLSESLNRISNQIAIEAASCRIISQASDHDLVARTEKLIQDERRLLAVILDHLREIDRRRLYSALGYRSLFEFATKQLRYSESEAYARINAMKLVREVPQLKTKIQDGELTITHMVHAQRLFNKEPEIAKLEVFEKIAGKSAREAERITLSLTKEPEALKPDRMRAVTEEFTELKFLVGKETLAKIEQLKGLLAHEMPNATLGDLLDHALAKAIEVKRAGAPRKRRDIFAKANHACENCGSTHALEIDHIIPRAKGGSDARENLRTLCRPCNQRAAIDEFGLGVIDRYL